MKRLLSAVLGLLLILSSSIQAFADLDTPKAVPAPYVIGDEYDEKTIRYETVASNNSSILYADMKYGYFALKNKANDCIWYSVPVDTMQDEITAGADKYNFCSQLVVKYLFKKDIMSASAVSETNSYSGCIEKGAIEVKKLNDGIRVNYHFGDIGTTVPVEYRLKGDSFSASIDLKKIDEGKECFITDIGLLPTFGAGGNRAEGQLFVPDGCGALINFNNGTDCKAYEAPVYGEDLIENPEIDCTKNETVRLPVFATLLNDKALMGVITKGDGSASIRAVNGNESRYYNAVSTVCNLRSLERLVMFKNQNRREIGRLTALTENADTFEVVYTALYGKNADYVGVAQRYREYLIEEKGLEKQSPKPSLSIDLYGAIDVKSAFLGFEYSKLKPLTTFLQAKRIIEKITEKSESPVAVRYLGWNNYGLLNRNFPDNANALSVLGGNNGFKSLRDFVDDGEDVLYADADFIRIRKGSGNKVVKDAFNKVVEHTERLRSVFAEKLDLSPVKLISPQYLDDYSQKFLKSVKKRKITAVSLSTLGNMIYSNTSEKAHFHRCNFPKAAEKVLSEYKKAGISLAVDGGNAYTLPYASRVYNAPTVCSGYNIFDREIPFYQIVLHGYVAMTSAPMAQALEKQLNILKTAEGGSELLYGGMYTDSSAVTGTRYDYLYATGYKLWITQAIENSNRYYSLQKAVYDSVITEHRELKKDVMLTVYENGVRVIVNYSANDVTADGVTVAAENYFVVKGDK